MSMRPLLGTSLPQVHLRPAPTAVQHFSITVEAFYDCVVAANTAPGRFGVTAADPTFSMLIIGDMKWVLCWNEIWHRWEV